MTKKHIKQLEEVYGLGADVVLDQLNQQKEFINVNESAMSRDELLLQEDILKALEEIYEEEKATPTSVYVLEALQQEFEAKTISKFLNLLSDPEFNRFEKVVAKAMEDIIFKKSENMQFVQQSAPDVSKLH